jgi:ABC-2 type transport system ATP-binding protein
MDLSDNKINKRGRPRGSYGPYNKTKNKKELTTNLLLANTNTVSPINTSSSPINTVTSYNAIKTTQPYTETVKTEEEEIDVDVFDLSANVKTIKVEANLLQRKKILEVKHLAKRYKIAKTYVFQDISFTLESGDIVGILGENGAGKSTLLKCITGLTPIDKGQIFIDSLPLEDGRDRFNVLWVESGMQSNYTVSKNFRFWCSFYCIDYDEQLILKMLKPFGVAHLLHTPYKLLSTGQKRKVCIARTFLKKVPLYILDEATSGLDFASQVSIQKYIKTHVEQNDSTFLFVTHLYTDLMNLCTKVMLIDSGNLIDYCSVVDLIRKYLKGIIITLTLKIDDVTYDIIIDYLNEKNVAYIKGKGQDELKILYLKFKNPGEYNVHDKVLLDYIINKKVQVLNLDLFVTLLMQGIIFKPTD